MPGLARDYEAKSALDSYESEGLDNDVNEGGYEEQLAAMRMAEDSMEQRDAGRRGRKRMPGALEGVACIALVAQKAKGQCVMQPDHAGTSTLCQQPRSGAAGQHSYLGPEGTKRECAAIRCT